MNNFFVRIENLLKQQKKTQKELSEYIGLSAPQAYTNWKARNSMPSADMAVKIAEYLNTTVEYLVTGTDKSPFESENKNLKYKLEQITKIVNEKENIYGSV